MILILWFIEIRAQELGSTTKQNLVTPLNKRKLKSARITDIPKHICQMFLES